MRLVAKGPVYDWSFPAPRPPPPGPQMMLPLFPLNTVLFPGMVLPLRIFEPRYLQMIAECQSKQHGFGVCLIREGPEVGGTADPHQVGTMAEITRITSLAGGHLLLQAEGTRRFRIQKLQAELHPWLSGEVELLDEDDVPHDLPLALQVQALMERYLELLRAASGHQDNISLSGTDSNQLSWLVAASLMIAPADRQQLLELDHTAERLQRETALLQEHVRVLEARLAARPYPFSMN
ncbi:MAG: LON peptidase substrate-binding domain-containing protein [Candidatus Xenobia bacterium]